MEAFLYSLAATGLSFVAWLAYKHPKPYAAALPYLFGLLFIYTIATGIWNAGVTHGAIAVRDALDPIAAIETSKVEEGIAVPAIYVMLPIIAGSIFFVFLLYLPEFLSIGQSKDQRPKVQETEKDE